MTVLIEDPPFVNVDDAAAADGVIEDGVNDDDDDWEYNEGIDEMDDI